MDPKTQRPKTQRPKSHRPKTQRPKSQRIETARSGSEKPENGSSPSCLLVGRGFMSIRCGEMLLAKGWRIRAVVTEDPELRSWAESRQIDCHAWSTGLATRFEPCDYLFSVVNFHVLPPEWLNLARRMAINFHDGPLPDYAGRWTPTWALWRGEKTHGISWHQMLERVDRGPLLVTRSFAIEPHDTSASLNARCLFEGLEAFAELLAGLAAGTLEARPQPDRKGRFFRAAHRPPGLGLLDWSRPAEELERCCRALDFGPYGRPWGRPKAVFEVEDRKPQPALFEDARRVEGQGSPGEVLRAEEEGLVVATGQGALLLRGLRRPEGEPLAAGTPGLTPGCRLRLYGSDELQALSRTLEEVVPREEASTDRLEEALVGLLAERSSALGREERGSAPPAVLSGPAAPYPRQQTLHQLFERRARRDAGRTALVFGHRRLTYGDLDARSEELARGLRRLGAGPGTLVGLHVERSPEMVAAMLGILKSGAAYLPLDPHYPAERLAFKMTDSASPILVSDSGRPAWLPAEVTVLDLTAPIPESARTATAEQDAVAATADDLAYVMYTSGSTGKPKGVCIPHRAAVNFLYSMRRRPGIRSRDVLLAVTSMSFDISVLEIFGPLLGGATVVLADRESAASGGRLRDLLETHRITVMQATPSTWELLLRAGWNGSSGQKERKGALKMLCGGEALPRELAQRLRATGGELWNMYGPTETTVWSTLHPVTEDGEAVSIGRPIANTQVYILDEEQSLVPRGRIGELWIGGDGLASGYLERPELTAERFRDLDLEGVGRVRLYRTGDLAAVTSEGRLSFHGRADHQVKIRGYRIELEEIEAVLEHHPAVDKAVVGVRESAGGGAGNKRLIAWLRRTAGSELEATQLRAQLARELPPFMVPDFLVEVDAFPQTPNGKVDRRALPEPSRDNTLLAAEYSAPESRWEQLLAGIWRRVLDLDEVGTSDDFFQLGGNSLKVEQLARELSAALGRTVSPVTVFVNPTVSRLAEALAARFGQGTPLPEPEPVPAPALAPATVPRTAMAAPPSPARPVTEAPRPVVERPAPAAFETGGGQATGEPIAIVGMACRFPGAEGADAFFRSLCQGRDAIDELPRQRWSWRHLGREHGRVQGRWQGVLEDVDRFDFDFFGIPLHEARRMDPMQRLFLETAFATVENAGYRPEDLSHLVCGVYVGLISGEYDRILDSSGAFFDAHTATGTAHSLVANRVSFLFDWQGPSLVVDTACSSSLVCLDLAVRALRAGQLEAALVGGVNLVLVPDNTIRFSKAGMLSPDGRCLTFDHRANGYVRGEGAGAVLLKPLSRALADGDHIWALVRGTAVNHDGSRKMGLTAPNPQAQEELLESAYRDAGVAPESVGCVEAHGTGTALGDPIEIEALSRFFARHTERKNFCALGSVKTNIGHLEAAAGIAGLIKTALCLKHAALPPTLHVRQPNERIAFEETPFYINDRLRPWHTESGPRRAGVSSFGYGGTNAHAVLEEPPAIPAAAAEADAEAGSYQLLCLSARNPKSLERLVAAHREALPGLAGFGLRDLCLTAARGRRHGEERLAIVFRDGDQLADKLRLVLLAPASEMLEEARIYRRRTGDRLGAEHRLRQRAMVFAPAESAWLARCLPALADLAGSAHEAAEIRAEGRTARAFEALAEAYAGGLEPAWDEVFGPEPFRRAPLPTYPYDRHRAWIDAGDERWAEGLHPLVESEKAELGGACYRLEAAGRWQAEEHLVLGEPVTAGMALVDLVLSLARRHGVTAPCELRRLRFHRPLRPGAGAALLLEHRDGPTQVGLYELRDDTVERRRPLLTAELRPLPAVDTPATATPALPGSESSEETGRELAPETVYEAFHRAGLDYGARFRVLQRLLITPTAMRAELLAEGPESPHAFHPGLADGALQAVLAPYLAGELWVPFGIESLRWYAPLPRRIVAEARVEETHADGVRASLELFDGSGRCLARLEAATWRVFKAQREQRQALTRLRRPILEEAPALAGDAPPAGTWLVYGDGGPLTEALRRRLRRRGLEPRVVRPALHFNRLAEDCYELNPLRADHHRRLLEELGSPPAGVLTLWSLRSPAAGDDGALDLGLRACSHLVRALPTVGRLCAVVHGVHSGDPDPAAAALAGFLRVLGNERPGWRVSTVELRRRPAEEETEEVAGALVAELAGDEPEVILDLGPTARRQRPALAPLADPRPQPGRLRVHGVYLVTGGLGGIGTALARHLSQRYDARLALVGRRGGALPPALAELVEQGHEVEVFAADVADAAAMAAVLDKVRRRWGGLDGVFHAAGVLRDGLATGLDAEDLEAVLRPKVRGAQVLAEVTAGQHLDFLAFFSSVSGWSGNPGQAAYAAANRYLDAYARQLAGRGLPALAIDWGLWRDTGMGRGFETTAEARGLATLSASEGLAILETALALDTPHLVVAAATGAAAVGAAPQGRLAPVVAPAVAATIATTAAAMSPAQPAAVPPAPTSAPSQPERPAQAPAAAAHPATGVGTRPGTAPAAPEEARELVLEVLAQALERDGGEVEAEVPFLEMGLDSLLAVKVVELLEERTGLTLPPTLLFDHATADKLAQALVRQYGLKTTTPAPGVPEVRAVPAAEVLGVEASAAPAPEPAAAAPPVAPKPEPAPSPAAEAVTAAVPSPLASPAAEVPVAAFDERAVAVVGLAGRFPGADSVDELWRVLVEGRNQIREVPRERWDAARYFDAGSDAVGSIYAKWGGFLDDLYGFDPMFFRLSPAEAEWLDPQQRLLLETSWEALENAGYASRLGGETVGVFVGASYTHYRDLKVGEELPTFAGLGNHNAILANRLSYFLDLRGPCLTVDTLCSSSLVALQLAVEQLRAGACSHALVAGVHAGMSPKYFQMACRLRAFSPTGRCHTFDRRADGFTPGEGCGVILLKPLAAALRDGDHIHGVIRGVAVNHGGQSSGMTVPNGEAQSELVRAALADAGVAADSIGYVEAHGTGTPLGDPIEVAGLTRAFRRDTERSQFCGIGSLKTNIGHLEPAAGIAGLIKVLLCLRHRQLPPSLLSTEVNPALRFEETPFYLVDRVQPWHAEGPRRAGVSSFGMGGVNGHAIVEEAPARRTPAAISGQPSAHLFVLSARSPKALDELVRRHGDHGSDELPAAAVATTLALGRAHFDHRLAVVAGSTDELRRRLREADGRRIQRGRVRPARDRRVAFLFTGQGAQAAGMGLALYAGCSEFRRHLDACAAILDPLLPRPLMEALRSGEEIHQTGYAQPLLFALEISLARTLMHWGVTPAAVLGHSVGEYVAAVVAETLDLEDGLRLIAERARLMQSLPAGGAMAAVHAQRRDLDDLLGDFPGLVVAAENGPSNTVLSGAVAALEAFLAGPGQRFKTTRLQTSHAFHSPLMAPVAERFERFAEGIPMRAPRLSLISNLSGARLDAAPSAAYWRDHLLGTVRFAEGAAALAREGVSVLLEVGPKPTLVNLCRSLPECAGLERLSTLDPRVEGDWPALLETLGALYCLGVPLRWEAILEDLPTRRVPLPTYPFEHRHLEAAAPAEMGQPATAVSAEATAAEHPLLGRRRGDSRPALVAL